jgi:hypothetical protein
VPRRLAAERVGHPTVMSANTLGGSSREATPRVPTLITVCHDMTKWLIQKGYDDEQADRFISAINLIGEEYAAVKYIPFGNEYKPLNDVKLKEDDLVLFIGTIQMYKFLHKTTRWKLGWTNFEILKCHVYYDYFGRYLIDPDYRMLPLREVIRRRQELYAFKGGMNRQIFIRPDDNAKSFNGEVVDESKLDEWFRYATYNTTDFHSVCVVASVATLKAEWRLVIADRKVIAGSRYRLEGSVEWAPGYPQGVADFAEMIANEVEWQPHAVYCMDIADTEKGYKLIEIGSVNTCGFYECDLRPVVQKMSEIAEREWADLMA